MKILYKLGICFLQTPGICYKEVSELIQNSETVSNLSLYVLRTFEMFEVGRLYIEESARYKVKTLISKTVSSKMYLHILLRIRN